MKCSVKALAGAALRVLIAAVRRSRRRHRPPCCTSTRPNDPLWKQIAKDYNTTHPGVKVVVKYLENEAYKAKLPTLLQSADKPGIILQLGRRRHARPERGRLRPGHQPLRRPTSTKPFTPPALDAFKVDGKLVGVPFDFSEVCIYYNKELFEKAGVEPARRSRPGTTSSRA